MSEFTIDLGDEKPEDVVFLLRAQATQWLETSKNHAILNEIANQIEKQIPRPEPQTVGAVAVTDTGTAWVRVHEFSSPAPWFLAGGYSNDAPVGYRTSYWDEFQDQVVATHEHTIPGSAE